MEEYQIETSFRSIGIRHRCLFLLSNTKFLYSLSVYQNHFVSIDDDDNDNGEEALADVFLAMVVPVVAPVGSRDGILLQIMAKQPQRKLANSRRCNSENGCRSSCDLSLFQRFRESRGGGEDSPH